jgi:hypothetical protein
VTLSGADAHVGEARVLQDAAQGPGAEEAQVVRARVEVAVGRDDEPAVPGRRHEQRGGPPQDPPDLGEQSHDVGDVLEHLPRPDDVEGVLGEGQRAVLGHGDGVQAAGAGPADGLVRDVGADDLGARRRQLGPEAPVPAAQVEHARSRGHVRQQERAARGEALWLGVRGHRAPDRLAPGLD